MEEYVELLILAYFRDHSEEYSLQELREMIGISFVQLDDMIECMISDGKLFYEEARLRISFEGRILLMNSAMEEYHQFSEDEAGKYLLKKAWPVDKPFYVSRFSKKKWRDA